MSNADDRATARRTLIVIGLVLASAFTLAFVYATRRVLTWAVVAAFFAVALKPLVDRLQHRLVRRRSVATLLVFLAAFALLAILGALIVVPLFDEVGRFADRAPGLLHDARAGQGPLGRLLERTGARRYVEAHSDQLRDLGTRLRQPAVGVLRGVVETVAGLVTVIVLAYLMVLEAPRITRGVLAAAGDGRGERLRRVGREVSRTVTGYLTGNLLISVICGLSTYLVLVLTGVPFAAVIALLVAVADLIPLVGATLGAVIAAGAGFLHSPTAGVVVLVFFVVYQQVENHLLQPFILSRAVRLNPLTVLVSVLLAAELAGLLGALLAIPAAGIVQTLLREYGPRRPRPDPAPPGGARSAGPARDLR
ncbi:AI-2E family transporter [Micromonospora chokoriensis]|uniref:Predicted PurR-regulated permease PerM n=1 Tax=Micromonospora chokoriensis TaxID=356851 RepID=A0A1C4YET5_9ACTN|nr:AI-2E family transporter [Micromonospora chokoriensis]SCF19180.1 Predicted PurR-regulated permease PerM [Micromonospora chokoriensis]